MTLEPFNKFAATLVAAAAMALSLAGCDNAGDSRSAGQKLDAAVAKTEKAAAGLKSEAKTAGEEIKHGASNLVEKVDRLTIDARIIPDAKPTDLPAIRLPSP